MFFQVFKVQLLITAELSSFLLNLAASYIRYFCRFCVIMRINNNIPALISYDAHNVAQNALARSIRKLSSGFRINSASDDAAGLAISEKMRSQIKGLGKASGNIQDGISMIQTAEGALSEQHSMLQRMRELAVQAANDTLTSQDRRYIQMEIDQLGEAIGLTSKTTQFNKKKLLDGSASVLWSSDKLSTEVIVGAGVTAKDAVRSVQNTPGEGNYKISITAAPGTAQVQKSNIFDLGIIPVGTVTMPTSFETINIETGLSTSGAASGPGWNFTGGVLNITGTGSYRIEGTGAPTTNRVQMTPGITASVLLSGVNINATCAFDLNGSTVNMYLEGTNTLRSSTTGRAGLEVNASSTLVLTSLTGDGSTDGTLNATGGHYGAAIGGQGNPNPQGLSGNITINGGTVIATAGRCGAGIGGGGDITNNGGGGTITINGGDITASGINGGGAGIGSGCLGGNNTFITINGGNITANGGTGWSGAAGIGGGLSSGSGTIRISSAATVNATAGSASAAAIGHGALGTTTPAVDYAHIPNPTPSPTWPLTIPSTLTDEAEEKKLIDMPEFYTKQGNCTVDPYQTVTIHQGDGKSAVVTLYGYDTLREAMKKFNDAIAFELGQSRGAADASKFCTIADGTKGTSESVAGKLPVYDESGNITGHRHFSTLVVRSAVPGEKGRLHFTGDEELLKVLGLNEIQQASESEFTVSVHDAHSGKAAQTPGKVSGNVLRGVIAGNISVKFDPLANTDVSWSETAKAYKFAKSSEPYTTYVHIADNSTVLQTGAGEGEDMEIGFGEISRSSLGLDGLLVVTRELAAKAVSKLDEAIGLISAQRAKLGAYQNRLEHAAVNLDVSGAAMVSSESRIRDLDMSKEIMNMTRLKILGESGTAMMAQANQLPQAVMKLISG